jgi:predicted Fe-Mo cluster-binding NifX family protein
MQIAISAKEKTLDSEVDFRFGRAPFFLLVDPDTLEFEAIDNKGQDSTSGAGIAAARLLVDKKVETVITGECGPNAFNVLSSAGIEVVSGAGGSCLEAIRHFNNGNQIIMNKPSVKAHHGSGSDPSNPEVERIQEPSSSGLSTILQSIDSIEEKLTRLSKEMVNKNAK